MADYLSKNDFLLIVAIKWLHF